jgi:hypothetical protein
MIGVCSTRPVKYLSGAMIVGTVPHAMIFIVQSFPTKQPTANARPATQFHADKGSRNRRFQLPNDSVAARATEVH